MQYASPRKRNANVAPPGMKKRQDLMLNKPDEYAAMMAKKAIERRRQESMSRFRQVQAPTINVEFEETDVGRVLNSPTGSTFSGPIEDHVMENPVPDPMSYIVPNLETIATSRFLRCRSKTQEQKEDQVNKQ